jgi:hypothetical protein
MLNQVSPATPVANSLYADGIPKAWGTITTNGSSGAQSWAGMNIASAVASTLGSGNGKVRVTFETPAAATFLYTVIPTVGNGSVSAGLAVTAVAVSASVVDLVVSGGDPSAAVLYLGFTAFGVQ